MRNLLKFVAVFVVLAVATSVNAQAQKFGHIDLQALIQVMPERASAETEFNKVQDEMEEILAGMQKDLQAKMGEFEKLGADASEIKKNAKITEIQDIQQRIQNYQNAAGQQLQQKQIEVLQPVFDKAEKAIAEVAKEKDLLYVFDLSEGNRNVLYKSNQSLDLLPLVKLKLGIK